MAFRVCCCQNSCPCIKLAHQAGEKYSEDYGWVKLCRGNDSKVLKKLSHFYVMKSTSHPERAKELNNIHNYCINISYTYSISQSENNN